MNAKDTYKVVSYRPDQPIYPDYHEYFYRWYWQANLRSWIDHNLFFMTCNTFVKDGAKVKLRPVVYK